MKGWGRQNPDELTERESEILALVAQAKSNSEIATQLYIGISTVKFHMKSILAKLRVKNRTHAARVFLKKNDQTLGQPIRQPPQPIEGLTDQELQILRLVAQGKSNLDISNQVFLSIDAVKYHLKNIFSKLDVKNRTRAMLRFWEAQTEAKP